MSGDFARLVAELHQSRREVEILQGEVLTITLASTTNAASATVDLEGQGHATNGVLMLDSYSLGTPAPAAGDIVLCLGHGADVIILGRIS